MNSSSVEITRHGVCQALVALASGTLGAVELAEACLVRAHRLNAQLGAFVDLRPALVREQAQASAHRRREHVLGRLDGIPVAVKDSFDIAGWPTRVGLPRVHAEPAARDAAAVTRLRAAGAVLMGKTALDEGQLGAHGQNPHAPPLRHPLQPTHTPGGSSGGAAVAVASGMALAALGADGLGSVRIPASYCGLVGLKPTHGEISCVGLTPSARRLDCVGILAREVRDVVVLLQVLAGYDAEDAFSRKRRVAFALPDLEPGRLRVGLLPDLAALGVSGAMQALFARALATLDGVLGRQRVVDFADWDFARARRAGLLLMEAEMLHTFAGDLLDPAHPVSPRFRAMLEYARGKSAADYVAADRMLDAARLKSRRLFAQVDVLLLPTTPGGAYPLDAPEPANATDLTSFASLAGCPAVSIPMGTLPDGLPGGLQLVGPTGSDLRLLELAEVFAAALDATPAFPLGNAD